MADDTQSTPQHPPWEAALPFSERLRLATTEAEVLPSQPDVPHMVAPVRPQSELPTEPITIPVLPVSQPTRVLRILEPEELTDDEFRAVQLQMTALYHAQKLLSDEEKLEIPQPYNERRYIWRMIFQQMAPAAILLLVIGVSVAVFSTGSIGGWGAVWLGLGLLCVLLGYVWTAYRIYCDWRYTFLFSDTYNTGFRRRRFRWLLLTELNPSVETASLSSKDVTRGNFASFFSLNSWRVTLDSPTQQDAFLGNMRFVRDGLRLKETINANQQYLNRRRR